MSYAEVLDIAKIREYKVVKANKLIQKTRYDLTVLEQKTLAYIISMIKPTDTSLKIYEFEISEYCKVANIDYKSGGNYEYVKKTIKSLRDKSFWLTEENGAEVTVSWISKVWINKHSGLIKVQLDSDLHMYLIGLSQQFTVYELFNVIQLKSQFSIRIYELLKSYQFTKSHTFELSELQKMLMATGYKRYTDFRRFILEPALDEINEYTDLNITYTPIKKGRKVAKIKFNINVKSNFEQNISRLKFDRLISR